MFLWPNECQTVQIVLEDQTVLIAKYRIDCTDCDRRPDCADGQINGQTVQILIEDQSVLMAKYSADCTGCDRRTDCTYHQIKARLYRL